MIDVDYEWVNYVEWYDPKFIEPFHPAYDEERFDKIMESMSVDGWQGRPIVALRAYKSGPLRALTGSHRLACARQLTVYVPVYILDKHALNPDKVADIVEDFDTIGAKIIRMEPLHMEDDLDSGN